MKLQRYYVDEDGYINAADDGEFALGPDVVKLEAENEALHEECDRLTALLQWEQGRLERIGTHGENCWKWGPSHYECALRENAKLAAMVNTDHCVSDSELAKKILQCLGFSVEPSMEPEVDRRRDTIAGGILEAMDVAMLSQQKVLGVSEVTEGFYWQRDDDNCEWGGELRFLGWVDDSDGDSRTTGDFRPV